MLKEVRCAIYTRKSNEDGLEQKFNSLDAQRVACEKYIKSREGWVALAKRYDDGGYSGSNLNRPAIKELFEDVKTGEVDCVVVYTLDRLSRETKDCIEVTSFFRRHRISFVAVTQIFDNNTPMGKFVQTVLSGAAQLEREMIVERVKNKIATSKEQGLWMGGTLPLGYDVKDKELIINEKEAKTVKHIFERYVELKSMAELARELNREGYRTKAKSDIFKKATVRRIITNPIYMGKIRHYEKQYEGKHEAIIEEEKWQKAQELIKNQPYRKAKYEEALLRGIIKCKSCDANMTLTYSKKENKRYRYYVCNNHLRGKNCESVNRTIVAGEVEKEAMKRANDKEIMRMIKLILKTGGKRGIAEGSPLSPLLSNIYLNEVDKMLEKAKEVTKEGKYQRMEYARWADDLVILISEHPKREWLERAVYRRLEEELAKLEVSVNEEKTKVINLKKGETFSFLGFDFQENITRQGKWNVRKTPQMKARTNLLRKLKEIFRRYKSQPIKRVIHDINPILRGWVNYFRIGNSGRKFNYVKHWVEKKVRRNLMRARKAKKGFGWKKWSSEWIYKTLGLYSDYRIRYYKPKASPVQYVINFGKESARKA